MMKRMKVLVAVLLFGVPMWSEAIPASITYQGTLKEKGVPVSGDKQMIFRVTNQDGAQVYWSSGQVPVSVQAGLFAVQLDPAGVPWETITPYIEISINGQLLLPREPLTATIYATMSRGVIDGAISQTKLANDVQDRLVPPGLIGIFSGGCPAGWARFSALDNRFPMGAGTFGGTGGAVTHSHPINADGAHRHSGVTTTGNVTGTRVSATSTAYGADELMQDIGTQNAYAIRLVTHNHGIVFDGSHNHGGSTGEAGNVPPYLSVVYCQKQ